MSRVLEFSSLKYSECSYSRESLLLRDNREFINIAQTKKRSNSMADEENESEGQKQNLNNKQYNNWDLQGWRFYHNNDQK